MIITPMNRNSDSQIYSSFLIKRGIMKGEIISLELCGFSIDKELYEINIVIFQKALCKFQKKYTYICILKKF